MACDLEPKCNFLYGFFHCALPEDTINVEITVRALKGIHTFRKDHTTQSSRCSLWGSRVWSFPSLLKKMMTIWKKEELINPFTPAKRPNSRQALFPSIKNTTPTKRSKSDSKRGSKKHQKSMKIEGCYMPTKAAMPAFMPSPAIVTMMPTVPNPPATPNLPVSTATNYSEICKTWGRPCPMHTKPALPVSPTTFGLVRYRRLGWRDTKRERKEADKVRVV